MFTQQCFIRKSTKSLTDRLYRLGGRSGRGFWHLDYLTILAAYGDYFRCLDDERGNDEYLTSCGFIDCVTNEELFLAIAALRDDSDIHQWFTNGIEWIQCEKEDWIDEISSLCVGGNYNYDKNGELSVDFHKATVEELIKHFTV